MLDVSRDRVPTMEHLLGLVDVLASLKMNHLQLYTEHTFAYAGHEEVWRGWSPMTPEEVRTLDAHCRRRGVRLAANQNCFGHLASWLRHDRYAPLAEIGSGERWRFYDWERVGPFSLCPTDARSLALVEDMLGQLLPCFTSRVVNINCDETADVGQGRSRGEVERRGRFEVYRSFVSRVCEIARGHDFSPQFWADIVLAFPERLHELPEDLTALAWSYEPDPVEDAGGAAGKPSFARWGRALRGAGRTFWVCPGTSAWRSIVGRSSERTGNLRDAARAGAEHGAEGFMVTEWGDLGHRQQWPVSLHAIAHAAQIAWSGAWSGARRGAASEAHREQARGGWMEAADVQVWGGARGLSEWLERLGDIDGPLRAMGGALSGVERNAGLPLRNQGFLFADMHTAWDRLRDAGTREGFAHAERELDVLRAAMPRVDDALVRKELEHTLEVAGLALDRALARRRAGATRAEEAGARRGLTARVREIIDEHRRLWSRRSREGGLSSSCEHYAKVLRELGEGA
jgi:hypothetical protein